MIEMRLDCRMTLLSCQMTLLSTDIEQLFLLQLTAEDNGVSCLTTLGNKP